PLDQSRAGRRHRARIRNPVVEQEHADRAGRDQDHALAGRAGRHQSVLLLQLLQRAAPGDAGLHRGAAEGLAGRRGAAARSPERRGRGRGNPRQLKESIVMSAWLAGRFGPSQRWWIALAALLLLPVFFLPVLPIWTMRLWAPQYPEGLELTIYTNTIRGDLQKINTLNHYVGMKHITPQDFREFGYLPLALTLFGALALLSALVNRRWLAIAGWL